MMLILQVQPCLVHQPVWAVDLDQRRLLGVVEKTKVLRNELETKDRVQLMLDLTSLSIFFTRNIALHSDRAQLIPMLDFHFSTYLFTRGLHSDRVQLKG